MLTIAFGVAAADKPAPGEPAGGPAVGDGGVKARQDAAARAEEERGRPLREAVTARNQADLTRATFEHEHRAGPLAKDAGDAFEQVVAAYQRAIQRPNSSPEVLQVIVNSHLRVAGAYQYVGQFDKAVAQAKKGVEVSAGTASEVEATYNLGLIYLQALHDLPSALAALKRTQELIPATMKDPDEQAKWLTAASEAIARCQREAGEK
jgi:tetratricopeptide (TPR) repeat protein